MQENAPLLRLVKGELDSTLQHAEARLKAYSEGAGDALAECLDDFNQILGTSKLLNVHAAELFTQELKALTEWLEQLPENDPKRTSAIAGLSIGISQLERYFNYLNENGLSSPQLLLPDINEMRLVRGDQALPDSAFFSFERERKRDELRSFVVKPASKLPNLKDLRRLRHMYQVGLLEVIRNNEGGFRLMKRSLERVEAVCGNTPVAEIWPIAQIAIEAMVMGDVALTRSRKLLFAWLDRELKQLSMDGDTYLASEPSAKLVKELCYIIAISKPGSDKIKAAQISLEFSDKTLIDAVIREEREILTGPDTLVLKAVSAAINEEIGKLKDAVEMHCRVDGEDHDREILLLLDSVEKTLRILELDLLCEEVKEVLHDLKKSSGVEEIDRAAVYEPVIQQVLKIERVMTQLLKSGRMSAISTEAKNAKATPSGVEEETRLLSITESRASLALSKQSLTSFVDSGWDKLHLGNVPNSLHGVWGALYFLGFNRAADIILQIQKYIEQKLLADSSLTPTENDLETLADALTGVDYYLESLEQDKPLGVGVLEVAEESLDVLGFPVSNR